LEEAAVAATMDFVAERQAQGGAAYRAATADAIEVVSRLFLATDDLRSLADGEALATDPALVQAARYLDGPPISQDDLETIVDVSATSDETGFTTIQRVATVIVASLDAERFPWLFGPAPRAPTDVERDLAIRLTAGLLAVQRSATRRRGESAQRQEQAVKDLLRHHDFEQVRRRVIHRVGDLEPGQFCPEAVTGGVKCDVPIRLRNGYLLLIECKVSSSAVNSVKRLNHETGNKAREWDRVFGEQAFTMAVLAGVFRKTNLVRAQEHQSIHLVWERDLEPLADFLAAAV
jgi:hypothetical protein